MKKNVKKAFVIFFAILAVVAVVGASFAPLFTAFFGNESPTPSGEGNILVMADASPIG